MDVYKLIHIFKQFIILHTHLHIADWSTKYNKVQIVSANITTLRQYETISCQGMRQITFNIKKMVVQT